MDVLERNMFNNQHNTFDSDIMRSSTCNGIIDKFRNNLRSTKGSRGIVMAKSAVDGHSNYVKKRSYSDLLRERSRSEDSSSEETSASKRSKTAPPSPFPMSHYYSVYGGLDGLRGDCTSDPEYTKSSSECSATRTSAVPIQNNSSSSANRQIKLPGIAAMLSAANGEDNSMRLRPIRPTVSLDYFDTYKPHDENWRYGLLDSIHRTARDPNLSHYNHFNKNAKRDLFETTHPARPRFDSRISTKIINSLPSTRSKESYSSLHEKAFTARKINFPYESNYTYLNKTYLNDVKKYPEYLELAHSLVQLSKPKGDSTSDVHHSVGPIVSGSPETRAHDIFLPRSHTRDTKHYDQALSPPSSAIQPRSQCSSYSANTEISAKAPKTPPLEYTSKTTFIPVTPPSAKSKSKFELARTSPRSHTLRVCLSCGSDLSPCWRPSWSIKEGQLCNSCGLRYKKTSARCLNNECRKIPAKGEWALMQSNGKVKFDDGTEGYSCLECGHKVEVCKTPRS